MGRPAIWTSSLMTSSVVILLSMAKKASSRALKEQQRETVSGTECFSHQNGVQHLLQFPIFVGFLFLDDVGKVL